MVRQNRNIVLWHQVRAWMEEFYPGISSKIVSYIIGLDSLKTCIGDILSKPREDIRLRMDGLFEKEEQAIQLTKEFTALYTNGPAGGGGIRFLFPLPLYFLNSTTLYTQLIYMSPRMLWHKALSIFTP